MAKEMYDYGFTQNRDLSWLKFNQRVLQEAMDDNVPLLEKLKFISIFCSNLDEFFMVRVGSIFHLSQMPIQKVDPRSGLSNHQQLEKIYETVGEYYLELNSTYKSVRKELANIGIKEVKFNHLSKSEKSFVQEYFKNIVFQIVSPQIIDKVHPFPFIASNEVVIITRMSKKSKEICGLVSIPNTLPPLLFLPGKNIRYILMEDLFMHFTERIFKPYKIIEKTKMTVTRNADLDPNDEDYEISLDIRKAMESMLKKRKRLNVVRCEISNKISKKLLDIIVSHLKTDYSKIFINKTPLLMNYCFYLIDKLPDDIKTQYSYPKLLPAFPNQIDPHRSMFEQIKEKDLILHYPYQSMKPFLDLLKEASEDKQVTSIYITIYRLSRRSRLVEYLCRASENGINVTVLIELRARFDEQNNIIWSKALEEAGCRVVYGFEDFKVHSKICLITRREGDDVSFYTQIGTGNFNETTARQYTDLQLLTNDHVIGNDADNFFKAMLLEDLEFEYDNLITSPNTLKQTVLKLIDREIDKGEDGFIFIKINSLTDVDVIEKLQEASMANVMVTMVVRGICCLIPQVENYTENIRIFSIVGQFLEHTRVYLFGKGHEEKMYISSADFMTRNTERRVEVAVEIMDPLVKDDIKASMRMVLKDNVKIREILSDGNYHKIKTDAEPYISQEQLIARYKRLSRKEDKND